MLCRTGLSRLILAGIFLSVGCLAGSSAAHTVFKKQLQKQYPGLTIKCEACHIKGKKKTETNDFGKLFKDEMDSANLTSQWEALKGDEKKAFETDTMAPAFDEALTAIKEMENDDGKKYHDLLDAAEIENTKLKKGATKGTDVLEEDGDDKDEDADDSEDEEDGEKKDGDQKDDDNKEGDGEKGDGSDQKDDGSEKKDDGQKEEGKDGGKEGDGKEGDGKEGDGGKHDEGTSGIFGLIPELE